MELRPVKDWFLRIAIFAAIVFALMLINIRQLAKEASDAPSQNALVTMRGSDGNPLTISAEVATTIEQLTKGLMNRTRLEQNEGMLFVFPYTATENFWMKNTLIPLDMIFINENNTITKIHHAVPCTKDPCPLYNSEKPVKYVLEINGNLASTYNIEEGSKVEIAILNPAS